MDLELKLENLVPNPSCVYEALEPILASCETPENVIERTWLSIRLSMCEFAAAHVEMPSVCFDPSSMIKCTQLLETKATWWTTFSGNYRHISAICQEYRPQYEARKVLEVYRNATCLFNIYEERQKQTLATAEATLSLIVDQWRIMSANVTHEMVLANNDIESLKSSIRSHSVQFNKSFEDISVMLASTMEELRTSMDLSKHVREETQNFQQQFEGFENAMIGIQKQHLISAELLKSTVEQTSAVLQATNETLEGSAKTIGALISIFQLGVSIFQQFWSIAIICIVMILLVRILARSRFKYNTLDPKITSPDLDPLFL